MCISLLKIDEQLTCSERKAKENKLSVIHSYFFVPDLKSVGKNSHIQVQSRGAYSYFFVWPQICWKFFPIPRSNPWGRELILFVPDFKSVGKTVSYPGPVVGVVHSYFSFLK